MTTQHPRAAIEWPEPGSLKARVLEEAIAHPGRRTADSLAVSLSGGNPAPVDSAVLALRQEGLLKPRGTHMVPTAYALGKADTPTLPRSVSLPRTHRQARAHQAALLETVRIVHRAEGESLTEAHRLADPAVSLADFRTHAAEAKRRGFLGCRGSSWHVTDSGRELLGVPTRTVADAAEPIRHPSVTRHPDPPLATRAPTGSESTDAGPDRVEQAVAVAPPASAAPMPCGHPVSAVVTGRGEP